MRKKRKGLLTTLAARVTATASVALVLVSLAFAAMFGIGANRLLEQVGEEAGFVVIMTPEATVTQINKVKQAVGKSRSTAGYTYASPEQIEQRWNDMTGADSADRALLASLDVSPFQPELDVQVKSSWLEPDSLNQIMENIRGLEGVESVGPRSAVSTDISRTTGRVMIVLLSVAGVLLIISFMLINNTVRLSVYSRRFIINTMSLVGATDGYVRRPFVLSAMFIGLVGGLIADAIAAGVMLYLPTFDAELGSLITWPEMAIVLTALPVAGMAVCSVAAAFATNKYLGRSYDSLYE